MGNNKVLTTDLFTNGERWGDIQAWEDEAMELHSIGGVHRVEVDGYQPFWAVIDHAALLDVERRASFFHNAPRPVMTSIEQDAGRQRELRALIHMDGDEHSSHRALTADWFKPASIGRLMPRLDELSANCVNVLRERGGSCDWVPEVALPYPLQVILEILGLPQSDYGRMLRLTQELFGQEDPDLRREPQSAEVRERIVEDFFTYFRTLAAERQAHPTDDLATLIANGVINGEPISELAMLGYFIIAATAGHDTTSSAIAGMMHLLATHPDQFELLKNDISLMPNAVDESIRLTSPVRHFARTVVQDTRIGDRDVKVGDRVYLSYKAANLDPKVFENPRQFDIRRANANKTIAFGHGPHFCLGSQLARNELRSLFGAVVPALKSVELESTAAMAKSTFVGGHKSVPISYTLS